ncbi:MAG: sulfatase, partial [Chloroflexi bacterium]|nr:sulfatase [Chloroflexota bacterium]
MNIVLIILDTLRQDHVGAYGNPWIKTPHLDRFASEACVFTRAYPESLPTLPVRRALHTGLRTYPYHGHHDYKGDFSGAPGWGPIPEEQTTMAECLVEAGYRTAFITDCYHQFKPSKNFHRGFQEWQWIRGQEADPWRSGPRVPDERIAQHMNEPLEANPGLAVFLRAYLRNNAYRHTEQDYYPARVFTEASRWLWDNQDAKRFFLVVDSFDPHEPWDPPLYYRRLYDEDGEVADLIQSLYGPWQGRLNERELKRLQANYAGEVTMVDRWFGHLMETLANTGRLEDTVVAVISDHGHNIGHEPGDKGLVSKQGHPMTHAVADLVFMVRHPKGEAAGHRFNGL